MGLIDFVTVTRSFYWKHHNNIEALATARVAATSTYRALALDPEVMLFDEPTSSLDPELGVEGLTVMRELAENNMTMIVVTHEMHFAEDVSDRVVVMADGRVIEEGPSKKVMLDPQIERSRKFLSAIRSKLVPVKIVSLIVVEIGRGTPALVLLQFSYFGLPTAGLALTSFYSAFLGLTVSTGAHSSEIIRGGLEIFRQTRSRQLTRLVSARWTSCGS